MAIYTNKNNEIYVGLWRHWLSANLPQIEAIHYMCGFVIQVSHTFCHEFISLLLKDAKEGQFGRTEVLLKGLKRVR